MPSIELKKGYRKSKMRMIYLFLVFDILFFVVSTEFIISGFILIGTLFLIVVAVINWTYFYFLFDLYVGCIILVKGTKIIITNKKGKILSELDLCTLSFPIIPIKKEWYKKFKEKNRNVYLHMEDVYGNKINLGKSVISLGNVPMSEAIEIENWLKEQKEKICGKNNED